MKNCLFHNFSVTVENRCQKRFFAELAGHARYIYNLYIKSITYARGPETVSRGACPTLSYCPTFWQQRANTVRQWEGELFR
jgi:hypothetical protein